MIDTLIFKPIKAKGLLDKIHGLLVHASADSQAGRLNFIADLYNATAVAGPSFLADRGFQGDGSSSYLSTSYLVPNQDDNHIAHWSLTDRNDTGIDIGASNHFIQTRSSGNHNTRNHNTSSASAAIASSVGYYVNTRASSGSYVRYKDGVPIEASISATSIAPSLNPLFIGARGNGTPDNFSGRRLAITHFGKALTAQDVANLYSIFSAYLSAIGAI